MSKHSSRIIKVTLKELSMDVSIGTPALVFCLYMAKSLYISLPKQHIPIDV